MSQILIQREWPLDPAETTSAWPRYLKPYGAPVDGGDAVIRHRHGVCLLFYLLLGDAQVDESAESTLRPR